MKDPRTTDISLRSRALARFLDGEPEPEDGAALAGAMRTDPAFADEVRRLLAVDDLLRQHAQPDPEAFVDSVALRLGDEHSVDLAARIASALPVGAPAAESSNRTIGRRRLRIIRSATALVAGAAIAAVAFWAFVPTRPTPVARLVRAQDAWWQPGLGIDDGEGLTRDRWASLDAGVAEFEFDCGARATVRGPSLFRFCSDRCLLLSEGAVSVYAPATAAGFTVLTPGSEVIDRGTEFAVIVPSPQASQVHVRKGHVQVRQAGGGSANGTTHDLFAGDAVDIDELAGQVTPRKFAEAAFLRVGPSSPVVVAYRTRAGTSGNQFYGGKLGHDFVVDEPIDVSRLGVFDSDADGLNRTITCELWRRDDRGTPDDPRDDHGVRRLASLRFDRRDPGVLVDGNRFKSLPKSVRLEPGSYSIVAYGYGPGEPNGNDYGGIAGRHLKATGDGGGAVSFVGSGRFEFPIDRPRPVDRAAFPRIVDGGLYPDRYSAGTFEFTRVDR